MNEQVDQASVPYQPLCRRSRSGRGAYDVNVFKTEVFDLEVKEFLGCAEVDLVTEKAQFPRYDLPHLHQGFKACFSDWELIFEGGPSWMYDLWIASRVRIEVRPGRYEDFVDEGSLFYSLPDGSRRVVVFDDFSRRSDGEALTFSMISPRRDHGRLRRDLTRLQTWLNKDHYLKGQVLKANGSLLTMGDPVDWDDVALKSGRTR